MSELQRRPSRARRRPASARVHLELRELQDLQRAGAEDALVPKLPEETCNDALCVRYASGKLLRTRDCGKTWDELTANLGNADVVAAAAAGTEIIVARRSVYSKRLSSIYEYASLFRSIDDGRTFAPLTLPFMVTAFAPGHGGWYFGTHLYGIVRLPYAARAAPAPPPAGPPRR